MYAKARGTRFKCISLGPAVPQRHSETAFGKASEGITRTLRMATANAQVAASASPRCLVLLTEDPGFLCVSRDTPGTHGEMAIPLCVSVFVFCQLGKQGFHRQENDVKPGFFFQSAGHFGGFLSLGSPTKKRPSPQVFGWLDPQPECGAVRREVLLRCKSQSVP